MDVGMWLWELRYARARAWVKADLLGGRKGSSPGRAMASDQDPTGVDARGMHSQGQLGNLGEPAASLRIKPEDEGQTGGPNGLASAGLTSSQPTSRRRDTKRGSDQGTSER